MLAELRDSEEKEIEEFYVMSWSDDSKHLIAAGKLKSRAKWSEDDDDNHILPCPLKIFDVVTGKVIARLSGHNEEVFCIKKIHFKNENYLITCSEDGRIIKWLMNEDWSSLVDSEFVDDLTTSVATGLTFVPACGNLYFIAACDEGLKLFDFEMGKMIERWDGQYTYLCDCIKFVDCKEIESETGEYFLISRGVEVLDPANEKDIPEPNKCILHKLTIPPTKDDKWILEDVGRFEHESYDANTWIMRFASNGRYLVAPTAVGKVFIWNIRSKQVVGILEDHNQDVRDILYFPGRKMMLTCADDSKVNIYVQSDESEESKS